MRYRSLSVYIQDQWEIYIKYVPFKVVSIDNLIRPFGYYNFVSPSHFGFIQLSSKYTLKNVRRFSTDGLEIRRLGRS